MVPGTTMNSQDTLLLAMHHHQAGRLADAEKLYRQILTADPNNVDGLTLLGIVAYQAGNPTMAIQLIQRAIAIRPGETKCHLHLGIAFDSAGRIDDAIASFKRALELQPNHPQTLSNLGKALTKAGQLDAAVTVCRKAVAANPRLAESHLHLGIALAKQGHNDEAIPCFREVVRLRPQDAQAHSNLGLALSREDDLPAAIASYRQALALKPDDLNALNSLGVCLQRDGEIEEAEQCFRRVLLQRPTDPAVHWNLAETLLGRGDFEGAWPEYEWREKIIERLVPFPFTGPTWDGADLNSRRILIHNEWGLGDVIQLVRYIPMIQQRGGRIILVCPSPLWRLLNNRWPNVQLVETGQPPPEYDVRCEMSALPMIFRTTLATIPAGVPYLSADPEMQTQWKSRLPDDGRLKVGLVWANQPNPPGRCPPPSDWTLLQSNDIWWCSLQKPISMTRRRNANEPKAAPIQPAPPGLELTDWTNELNDFADTAALIANLDLILCVDTAVAHLAGAMGKPTWVLLKHVADWRWMMDRSDSPWYPTMKLFRQPRRGDWGTPIQQIAGALKKRTL
jgi:Flp pilus assembly protein TadD